MRCAFILFILLTLISPFSMAQTRPSAAPASPASAIEVDDPVEAPGTISSFFKQPLSLTFGAAGASDESGGLRVAIALGDELAQTDRDEIFKPWISADGRSGGFIDLKPTVDIETGSEDGFNHVVAKISGNILIFPVETEVIEGETLRLPKQSGLYHLIPISAGIEADDQFHYANGLVEIGYIPWLASGQPVGPKSTRFELGWNPVVGVFLQGGKKFDLRDNDDDENASDRPGAAADESEEEPDKAIGRIKAKVRGKLALSNLDRVMFIPEATYWYDFVNSESYHRVSLILQVKLDKNKTLEFRYDDGSGAPNFNTGDQFGVGLTLDF